MSEKVEALIQANGHAPIIYVAHAISGPINEGYEIYRQHKDKVNATAVKCARLGYAPIVPILLGDEIGHIGWEEAMAIDYSFVKIADVLFIHKSEWESTGAQLEENWALELGKKVVYSIEELEGLGLVGSEYISEDQPGVSTT